MCSALAAWVMVFICEILRRYSSCSMRIESPHLKSSIGIAYKHYYYQLYMNKSAFYNINNDKKGGHFNDISY